MHYSTLSIITVNNPGSMMWMGLAHCTDENAYTIMFGKIASVGEIILKRILQNHCERAWTESIGGSCVQALEYSGIIDGLSEG
jgi:hypothetical protein